MLVDNKRLCTRCGHPLILMQRKYCSHCRNKPSIVNQDWPFLLKRKDQKVKSIGKRVPRPGFTNLVEELWHEYETFLVKNYSLIISAWPSSNKCQECKITFFTKREDKKFCSYACRQISRAKELGHRPCSRCAKYNRHETCIKCTNQYYVVSRHLFTLYNVCGDCRELIWHQYRHGYSLSIEQIISSVLVYCTKDSERFKKYPFPEKFRLMASYSDWELYRWNKSPHTFIKRLYAIWGYATCSYSVFTECSWFAIGRRVDIHVTRLSDHVDFAVEVVHKSRTRDELAKINSLLSVYDYVVFVAERGTRRKALLKVLQETQTPETLSRVLVYHPLDLLTFFESTVQQRLQS